MLSILFRIFFVCIFIFIHTISSVHSHILTVKGNLKCAEFPASAVTVKLWKNSEKSVIDTTHADKLGHFQLSAETIEHDYTPFIVIYHDCDDGVKTGQRKLKFQVPKFYVGSGNTFDLGIFNLETRVKHNEEREKHVNKFRRRRHQWLKHKRDVIVEVASTPNTSIFKGRDEEPDDRNDPW
uniref:Transthyretin-like protein 46 n=1 Tax=Caenorhabditis japonica TaxID=281687 RepID=A0A8R1E392_CAEJA